MNDLHVLPRLQSAPIAKALRSSPVVILSGARQTGKSTLVRELGGEARTYLTLDEVQHAPSLLRAIKRAVDERRTPGRFLLTGSASLLLMARVSESLAGRAVHFTLWPLTRRERLGLGRAGSWSELFDAKDADWPDALKSRLGAQEDWRAVCRRGGYPTPAHELEGSDERALWFGGYVQTYLERDLRELSVVASLVDFRRLMRAACLRIGQLVNQTELGRDVRLSQPTVHRWLNLMETGYQLVRLPGFAANRTKRLIKTAKLYWSDVGLALHLAGVKEPAGAHLENLMLCDLLAWSGSQAEAPELSYWRTPAGAEVDFVIERKGQLLPIEVKASAKPKLDDARGLQAFRAAHKQRARPGLLVHSGSETGWIGEGVFAAPWWKVI